MRGLATFAGTPRTIVFFAGATRVTARSAVERTPAVAALLVVARCAATFVFATAFLATAFFATGAEGRFMLTGLPAPRAGLRVIASLAAELRVADGAAFFVTGPFAGPFARPLAAA